MTEYEQNHHLNIVETNPILDLVIHEADLSVGAFYEAAFSDDQGMAIPMGETAMIWLAIALKMLRGIALVQA